MISQVPWIDRHVHLEGGLDPAWVRKEAQRLGRPIPTSLENLWLGSVTPFESFIEGFLFIASLFTSKTVVTEAVQSITQRTLANGGSGFDLWCSPHWLVVQEKQISIDDFWSGLDTGLCEARALGVKSCVVVDAVNHFGIQHGHEVVDLLASNLPSFVKGFSTGGLEKIPFREWAVVFNRARKLGLKIAAHAGENGPGSNVKEAIEEAQVERIVHGVRAEESILRLLADRKIPVDVCPSSNRVLVPELQSHPLPRMLELGVRCGLGTDDPGVIPCSLSTERASVLAMGLSPEALLAMQRYGAEDAWCL